MMKSYVKSCAEYLRAFSNHHGAKLKSGHAHELVAAFFGYQSKAAMLADTTFPIEHLNQAQIFVPKASAFIEQRRSCLEDLPPNLPDTNVLNEELFAYLFSAGKISCRSFPTLTHLVEAFTEEYLKKNANFKLPKRFGPYEKATTIFNKPLYEFNPKIETTNSCITLSVTNSYYGSHHVHFQPIDVVVTIKLLRIAGHVSYGSPDISVIDISNQSIS